MEYASLGKVVFKVPDYKSHTEETKYEFSNINTIFAPSIKQFFGKENKLITVNVLWHIDFTNPLKAYKELEKFAEEGEPLKLIIGKIPIGNFVIKNIKADTQKIDANGNPIYIKATITLEEFTEKTLKTKKSKVKPKAVRKINYKEKKEIIEKNLSEG